MLEEPAISLPRKERERLQRRREILLAARKVFAEKGFEHASVEEIAREAEFSKGALYNYFLNKEAIFIALLEEGFNDFERMITAAFKNNHPIREQFEQFARDSLAYFEDNPDVLAIMMKEHLQMKINFEAEFRERFADRRQQLAGIIVRRVSNEMAAGVLRKLDPVLVVEVFWDLVFSFLLNKLCPVMESYKKKGIDDILDIFFEGVAIKSQRRRRS